MYFIYVYLDTRKKGLYSYGDLHFEYEPFYIGKGTKDRQLTHLRIAKGLRKGKVNKLIAKIRSMLNDGYEPQIIKVMDNLTRENYNYYEIELIKIIGKDTNGGPLLNIMDGGDGGITWQGDHHNKGKKLEEIIGEKKAIELKIKLSKQASKRIGELNPNWGNKGESNPNWGRKHSEETLEKIRQSTFNQFSNYSKEEISEKISKMNEARKLIPDNIKNEWYTKISKTLKEKKQNGELFTEEHRHKLRNSNFRKLNKGSNELKISDETKKKISEKLKNRTFTLDHRIKLRKCISFEEFEIVIINLIKNNIINTITAYRTYAKQNPELKYPQKPEKSYKNCGWSGWRKYGL
jgi:hypothetical protein